MHSEYKVNTNNDYSLKQARIQIFQKLSTATQPSQLHFQLDSFLSTTIPHLATNNVRLPKSIRWMESQRRSMEAIAQTRESFR
jgi:hypothetical protein